MVKWMLCMYHRGYTVVLVTTYCTLGYETNGFA